MLAAVEGAIHEGNVDAVRASVIVEGASGPVTAAADARLRERDVLVVPDLLAGAGPAIAGFLESVQNHQRLPLSEDKVERETTRILSNAFRRVRRIAEAHHVPLRQAAYRLAIHRMAQAAKLRGR